MPSQTVDSPQNGAYKYETWSLNSEGLQYSVFSGSSPVNRLQIQRSSVSTPDFWGRLRRGEILPVNDFLYQRAWTNYLSGVSDTTIYTADGQVSDKTVISGSLEVFYPSVFYSSTISPTGSVVERLTRLADQKIRLKLKDQKVNIGQVIAERRMTMDLVASTATKLASAFASLKRNDFRAAGKALGVSVSARAVKKHRRSFSEDQSAAIGSGWLQLQYGWKPLLQDVYGSAEHLASLDFQRVTGRVSARSEETKVDDIKSSGGGLNYRNLLVTRCVVQQVVHYINAYNSSSQLASLGLTNPATLAWELLPFSFVVDWFIPIGNFISSWDATLGLVFSHGSHTVFFECDETLNTTRDTTTATAYRRVNGIGKLKTTYVRRLKLVEFPGVHLPNFKNPLSDDHALNAMALLSQTFKK